MEEVWIVQTGNFTLNGLVLLLFCNFFGKVKVVLEPQDMLADLIRVLAFAYCKNLIVISFFSKSLPPGVQEKRRKLGGRSAPLGLKGP